MNHDDLIGLPTDRPLPLVSVGMPTYNRPQLFAQMLSCVTQQTYRNLEIIVSDNCSPTDKTESMVRALMTEDPRIRYFKQSQNIGAIANFAFVLQQATGEYFIWAADDDSWHERYIEKCMDKLLHNRQLVLCYSEPLVKNIAKQTETRRNSDLTTVGLTKRAAIRKILLNQRLNTEFYGVMKTAVAARYQLRNRFGDDHLFLLHMAFNGEIDKTDPWLYTTSGGTISANLGSLIAGLGLSHWHWYIPWLIQSANIIKLILLSSQLTIVDKLSGIGSVGKRLMTPYYKSKVRAGLLTGVEAIRKSVWGLGKR
ncbi:MAG: glycosyltransferase family 2 protein [Chloroflexota bacterium]